MPIMERRAQPDGLGRAARGAPRRPWSHSGRTVPRILVRPIQQFMRQEASGGIVLLAATSALGIGLAVGALPTMGGTLLIPIALFMLTALQLLLRALRIVSLLLRLQAGTR